LISPQQSPTQPSLGVYMQLPLPSKNIKNVPYFARLAKVF
jgi:hypothetical protein